MDHTIGMNAGRVWRALTNTGPQTSTRLAKALELKTREVDLAVGWLAREGKVAFEDTGRRGVLLHAG